MWLLIAAVWGWSLFLSTAPFGFDIRSKWGLDVEDQIASWLVMLVLLISAVATAHMERSSAGLLAIMVPVFLGVVLLVF
jgi:hypothetical protein